MTELSTQTRRELAYRSGDGMAVTLARLQGDGQDGKDKLVVRVCNRREGAYSRS